MIFHLSYEIPKKTALTFDDSTKLLSGAELVIIKEQIRKNTVVIDEYVAKLHLFVN